MKHLSMWTIYNACKSYGWPKVYRRLLEYNRSLYAAKPSNGGNTGGAGTAVNNNNSQRMATQRIIRMAIEEPPKFVQQIELYYNQYIQPLFQHIVVNVSSTNSTRRMLPPFVVEMIKYVLNSAKPIKLLKDFMTTTGGKATTSTAK